MRFHIIRFILRMILAFIPERFAVSIIRLWFKIVGKQTGAKLTDKFLELLLRILDLFLDLCEDFKKNIHNFRGRYLFQTQSEIVVASAVFENGEMEVMEDEIEDWDVRITFKDAATLRRFIFAEKPDVLDYLLDNAIDIDGNMNYLYKFLFIVQDLNYRLGVRS